MKTRRSLLTAVGYLAVGFLTSCLFVIAGGCASSGQASAAQEVVTYPKINLTVGYEFDRDWPQKPANVRWEAVTGVSVDAQDRIWALVHGNMPIQVYSTDGKLLDAWEKVDAEIPHQIRIDHDGNIWLSDTGLHVVRKFSPKGELLLTLGTPGEAGEDDKHFNKPTDMAISPTGEIFVSDGYINNRIVHFDAQGRFVKTWGKQGSQVGELYLPHSIAMDSKGRLYVVERNNGRIQVFDQAGRSLAVWVNLMMPWSVCITPQDEIYVCGSSPMRWGEGEYLGVFPKDQMVMKLNPEGRVLEVWTFPLGQESGSKPGQLACVHGIGVDSDRNLYLGDVFGQRVQKFVRLAADR